MSCRCALACGGCCWCTLKCFAIKSFSVIIAAHEENVLILNRTVISTIPHYIRIYMFVYICMHHVFRGLYKHFRISNLFPDMGHIFIKYLIVFSKTILIFSCFLMKTFLPNCSLWINRFTSNFMALSFWTYINFNLNIDFIALTFLSNFRPEILDTLMLCLNSYWFPNIYYLLVSVFIILKGNSSQRLGEINRKLRCATHWG